MHKFHDALCEWFTNYVKGSSEQRLHSSLSISWKQQQPSFLFNEHPQRWEEGRRGSSSCVQIREVTIIVDPASTQAGQIHFSTNRREEAGRQVKKRQILQGEEALHQGRKLWPGFCFTLSFICRALSLTKVENNGHESLFWPRGSWGVP